MLSSQTRQVLATTTLALCCASESVRAQSLRASPSLDTAQDASFYDRIQDDSLLRLQEHEHHQQHRELGGVIMLDVENNSNQGNLDDLGTHQGGAILNYPQFTGTAIDYSEDLVTERSGPHASNETIDIQHHPTDNDNRNDIVMQDRVVGGKDSGPRSWYAMLLYQDAAGWKFAGCGATLVSNCHIITAAHCVEDRDFDIEGIYLNAHTPYSANSGHPFHFTTADKIYVPDNYDDYTNVNDIAIIKMSQCVDVDEFPIAVPAMSSNSRAASTNGYMLELYGFGRFGENLGYSGDTKQLQRAELPFISNESCQNYFGNKIKYGMFCAGFPEKGGVDACQGDSGSGLLAAPQYQGDPSMLMGVVSWGVGCARLGYPGVYAAVADYEDWIKSIVCTDTDLDNSITWCQDSSSTTTSAQPNVLMLRSRTCHSNDQCDVCEGSCQSDNHCSGDLECFRRSNSNPYALIPGCRGTGVAGKREKSCVVYYNTEDLSNSSFFLAIFPAAYSYCYDPNLSRFAETDRDKERQKNKQKEYASRTTMWTTKYTRGRRKPTSNKHEKKRKRNRDGKY